MSGWDGHGHNDVISFTGYVVRVSESQGERSSHRLVVQDMDGNEVEATVSEVSPAAEMPWNEDQWYELQNVLVKQRDHSTELNVTEKTTAERADTPSGVQDVPAKSQVDTNIVRNQLSELYEAFRSLNSAISIVLENESTPISKDNVNEPLVQYQIVLESILYGKEYLSSDLSGYGAQQSSRIPFHMEEYREEYGNGDWVTEYHCIDVELFKKSTRERFVERDIVSDAVSLVRPVAPESEQPLPEIVTNSHELEEALTLLSEFPAIPTGTTDDTKSDRCLPLQEIYANLCDDIGEQALLDPADLLTNNDPDKSEGADTSREAHSISETLAWLQEESSHSSEIVHQRTQPSREPQFEEMISVSSPATDAAYELGITSLYTHQKEALEAATAGDDVVLATATASGKSLPYRLLALDRAYTEQATTLYIAPTKALINDQAADFQDFVAALPEDVAVSVDVYTGDTPDEKRGQIRRDPPNILLMTPELVHTSLLPYHNRWRRFLQHLETVVIDEVHEFRGLFGSHIGLLFRRLNRLLSRYGQNPSYFCCSATIGNPISHASTVTGRQPDDFSLIDDDTSGRGRRFWLLYNPRFKKKTSGTDDSDFGEYPDNWDEIRQRVYRRDEYQCTSCGKLGGVNGSAELHAHHIVSPAQGGRHSLSNLRTLCADCHSSEHGRAVGRKAHGGSDDSSPDVPGEVQAGYERRSNHPMSIRLFTELVARGHQTLVFTRTRQGTEQYAKESANRLEQMGYGDLTERITAYHAAREDDDREAIERGLQTGAVRGVWSTNALELGIDIGSLDAVVVDGHPGTNMSLFQQTGRGGRGEEDCLILFVAQPNPLDQYWINNPDRVFDDPPAEAKINPNNTAILPDHIVSAADEHPLRITDETHFGPEFADLVPTLTNDGRLVRSNGANGIQWDSTEANTQYNLALRGDFDTEYTLIDQARDEQIGSLTFPDVLQDCHPGAIYTYRKRDYRVDRFDETRCLVYLSEISDSKEFTRPLFDQSVSVQTTHQTKSLNSESDVSVGYAEVVYEESLDGYLQFDYPGDDDPIEKSIDAPLPDHQLRTNGLYITIPQRLEDRMRNMINSQEGVIAGIHAIEHAMQSMFPLEVLCSTNDVTGLSVSRHQHTDLPTIFILDDVQGGAGLTQSGYDQISSLLQKAQSVISSCDCQGGCPSCIYLNTCRSQNRVLNKELALYVLGDLVEE